MSARWRLAAPHYLAVEGTHWEYSEVDRVTGRPKRTKFNVPLLLDPDNPSDWNIREGDSGQIVVTNKEDPAFPRDIVFQGDCTPDMVPLNDEAKKITASYAGKWAHPIESLSTTYADEMLKDLGSKMDEARQKAAGPAQVEGMKELLAAMAQMMKQNQEVLQVIAGQATAKPTASAARRP